MFATDTFTVIVTGLGGQGILFLSRAIANAAFYEHQYVCRTESRGLSQRGGCVNSIIRFGSKPVAAVVDAADADLVIALEVLEGVRNIPLLKSDGTLICSDEFVPPANLILTWNSRSDEQNAAFSKFLRTHLRDFGNSHLIPSGALASRLNSPKSSNMVLLGAASPFLPISQERLKLSALSNLSASQQSHNSSAFDDGKTYVQQIMISQTRISA